MVVNDMEAENDYQKIIIRTNRRQVTVREKVGYRDNKQLFYMTSNKVKFDTCIFSSINDYNNIANENLYHVSKNYITDEVTLQYKALGCFSKQYVMLTSRVNNNIFQVSDPIYIFPNGIKLNFYSPEFLIRKPWSEFVPELEKIFLLDEGSLKELNSLFVLLELGGNR